MQIWTALYEFAHCLEICSGVSAFLRISFLCVSLYLALILPGNISLFSSASIRTCIPISINTRQPNWKGLLLFEYSIKEISWTLPVTNQSSPVIFYKPIHVFPAETGEGESIPIVNISAGDQLGYTSTRLIKW